MPTGMFPNKLLYIKASGAIAYLITALPGYLVIFLKLLADEKGSSNLKKQTKKLPTLK